MDILLRFHTKKVVMHKAIMYDIAAMTSFVCQPAPAFNDLIEDRAAHTYHLWGVMWLTIVTDVVKISESYPDVVIEAVYDRPCKYAVLFARGGKGYTELIQYTPYVEFKAEKLRF